VLLARRAAVAVGRDARPVIEQARRFSVSWQTVQNAVEECGRPLVEDPARVGRVRQLGVDETSCKSATPEHAFLHATEMVDLQRRVVIGLIEGRSAAELRKWLLVQPVEWRQAIKVVATDLTDSYRSGMVGLLDHARKIADGFHVVQLAQRTLDTVRHRVQRDTLGRRGRRDDPLYRIRKLLTVADERLDDKGRDRLLEGPRVSDPNDEVLAAWLAKETVREIHLTDRINLATVMLGRAVEHWLIPCPAAASIGTPPRRSILKLPR
jgi:hypothetical protein